MANQEQNQPRKDQPQQPQNPNQRPGQQPQRPEQEQWKKDADKKDQR